MENGTRSDWSEPTRVEVVHHPLGQAIGLFLLGGVVFLATVGLIVAGSRAERRVTGQA
jgi:hypothetical protein